MGNKRVAVVTGVNGQDGSYLAELLLAEGYSVVGLIRRHSIPNFENLRAVVDHSDFTGLQGDVMDSTAMHAMVQHYKPDEIYNLAADSFVGSSWDRPKIVNEINFLGFVNILEAVRYARLRTRVYQASSSEMYGNTPPPQDEESPMIPRSPYGVSKLAAHRMARVYRESYGMFVASGICFNHESPRRGPEFVTRKIAKGIAAIKRGEANHVYLGNMDARRDWGFAGDYVGAMWMMLQTEEPEDFVVATGKTWAVSQFFASAVEVAGLPEPWPVYYVADEQYLRPAEVNVLRGDFGKIQDTLGWVPEHKFYDLVQMMVEAEL